MVCICGSDSLAINYFVDAFGGTMGASPYSYWSPNVDPSTVTSTHDLNCYAINSCRWRNVADDQLDWGQSIGAPDPNKWAYIMGTDVYPGVLSKR
jgi:hypothetical protein